MLKEANGRPVRRTSYTGADGADLAVEKRQEEARPAARSGNERRGGVEGIEKVESRIGDSRIVR